MTNTELKSQKFIGPSVFYHVCFALGPCGGYRAKTHTEF